MQHYLYIFIFGIYLLGSCSSDTQTPASEDTSPNTNSSAIEIEKVRIYAGQPGMSQLPVFQWKRGEEAPTGIEPRLIEYVLNQLGLEYEYVLNYPVDGYGDERIQAVMSDVADISIQGITITEGRSEKVNFSDPYYIDGLGVMVQSTSDLADLEDLKGKKVFAYRFSTTYKWAKENLEGCTIISQEDVGLSKHPITLLREGEIDAYLSDYSGLRRERASNLDMRIFPQKFTEEKFGIAISKKYPILLKEINAVLGKMRESGRLRDFTSELEK
ncbi:MAG: ABC transporter substrate-binding protein [Crocinitomicaceae bacterium]